MVQRERTNSYSPLRPVIELISSEYRELGVIMTYQIGVGILTLAVPIGVQAIVNSIAFTQLFQPVLFLAFAILFCQIVAAVFRVWQIVLVEKVQRRIFTHLGMELAYRLPRMIKQDIARFPEIVNRFFDVITVQKSLAMLVIEGGALFLQMIIGLILLACYHPMLLVYDIGLVVGLLVIVFVLGRGALSQSIEESKWKYKVVGWLEEVATKSVAFSSKSARFYVLQKADEIIDSYLSERNKMFTIILRQMTGFLGLQAIANAVLLSLGVWLVINNQLSIGQLVAAELVVSGVLYSFSRFQKHLSAFYDLVAALDKISLLTEIPLEHEGGELPIAAKSGIVMEARELVYQTAFAQHTVGPFSFTLAAGEKVAVHGSNGSGKSTLVDMLYGLKEPHSGVLLLNGTDVRLLSSELMREHISLLRGIEVVHGSIIKNVKLGCPGASLEHIGAVLDQVGLLDVALAFPQGLETVLSEDGAPFSVGQAKLLLLARAIIGKPRLLLIDQTLDGVDRASKETALNLVLSPSAPWSVLITSQDAEVERRCSSVIDLDRMNFKGGGR